MKYLRFIPLVVTWLPHVVKLVSLVEVFGNRNLSGAEKKVAVMAQLSAIAERSKLPWGAAAVEVVSDLIDTTVAVANFLGSFRKSAEVEGEEEVGEAEAAVALAHVEERKAADPVLASFLERTNR